MKITYILLALLLVTLVGCNFWYVLGTQRETTFTVEDKERITTGTGDTLQSKYLVFTDKGVFENTDSLLNWKFNSSDVYGELKEGQTYEAQVYGWRVPFLSLYPNIVAIEIRDI